MTRDIRVLLLSANPRGTTPLRLDEEAREIGEGLRRSSLATHVDIRSHWAVRPRDIRRALLDFEPEILHFSGHGTGSTGLAFENESGDTALVSTDAISTLFELFAHRLRCVVLNACYSDVQARAIAAHIDYVVGMQTQIGDRAAIEFAAGFYDALGAGRAVAQAYRFGVNAILLAGLQEAGTPVLLRRDETKPQASRVAEPIRVNVTTLGSEDRPRSEPAAPAPGTPVSIAAIDDVVQWGWSGTRLLRELIRLDYATTEGLTSAHEGDPAQWGPVFMTHPETWRLLVTGPRAIVGYWHWAPLFSAHHEAARRGELLDSMITVDTLQFFELPGLYALYFVQVCLLPAFRRPKALQKLLLSVLDVLDHLTADGVLVSEIVANAYTGPGDALCRTFNMQPLGPHRDHGTIFHAPIKNILRHHLALNRPSLINEYRENGLL